MSDFLHIIWLLPIIFMFHELEEIIFFKSWIKKNRDYLFERYPKLARRLFSRIEDLSVPAFTVAVAEEFLLLSVVTILSVIFNWYLLWLAVFMGYLYFIIFKIKHRVS